MQTLLAALIASCAAAYAAPADTNDQQGLATHQQAIADNVAKSANKELQFSKAPTDPIGEEVKLPLRPGLEVTLVRVNSTVQKDGSVTWSGRVKETGERAVLMLWANTMLTGYVAYQGTIFTLENAGGGVHASSEMNRGKLPPDHAPSAAHRDSASAADAPKLPPKAPPEPAVEPFPDDVRRALEAKPVTIDVMILYTPNAAKHYIRDPADLLALVIEEVNETYRNSGIGNVKLRLVHSQVVDYDGTKEDQFTHLYTMVDGLGPFKNVRKLRDEKKADIVGLIIDNPKGCGLSTRVRPDSDEAFFVVHHACAATTMSIGHEIGHILGARHDRFIDESNVPVAYGHGYVNGSKWRDVMSYKEGCGGCARIPFWSNPRVLYKGEPTGTPAADNARLILELADRVSSFR
ncbi:MAG: M12 family metallo-peptidase [Hyphomicrobiaceae bacterium]